MNEKAPLTYQRVVLCSNELPSPRESNTLYLFRMAEGEIKIYPLTFTKELITLTSEQADKLRSIIGKSFDQKSQQLTFIRDQHPELVNNIISVCWLHSLEPFLCEVQTIHDWAADITRELEEANTLEEKQKILAAILPKFAKRCRQLLANIHPDMLHKKDIAESEMPLYSVLTQIFLELSNNAKSRWERIAVGESSDEVCNLAEEYIEKLTEFNKFLREIVKEIREFNNFLRGYWEELKEIRTGIENVEAGIAKLREGREEIAEKLRQIDELKRLREPKAKTTFELIQELKQIRQSTQNLIDQMDRVKIDRERLCAILDKKEPYYSLYQNRDRLINSCDKVTTEATAVLEEPNKFDDSIKHGLIAQLEGLIEKLQELLDGLKQSVRDSKKLETFASVFNQGISSLFTFFKAAREEETHPANDLTTHQKCQPKPNLNLSGT